MSFANNICICQPPFGGFFMICAICHLTSHHCTEFLCTDCLERFSYSYKPKIFQLSHSSGVHLSVTILALFEFESVIKNLRSRMFVDRCSYALRCYLYLWQFFLNSEDFIYLGADIEYLTIKLSLRDKLRMRFDVNYLMKHRLTQTERNKRSCKLSSFVKCLVNRIKTLSNHKQLRATDSRNNDLVIIDDVVTSFDSYASVLNDYKADRILILCFAYAPELLNRKK